MVTYLPTVVAADKPVGDVLFAHVAQVSQKSEVHVVHGIPGNTLVEIRLCCEITFLTRGIKPVCASVYTLQLFSAHQTCCDDALSKRATAKHMLCCSIPQTGADTATLLPVRFTAP